jgi:hypothetical protein
MNTKIRTTGMALGLAMMLGAMLSVAPAARANTGGTGKVGYVYSVTLGWQQVDPQTKQVLKSGTYARYFVTVYADNSVDYGGADRGWYDILRYQNCRPYLANYSFVRTTTNG